MTDPTYNNKRIIWESRTKQIWVLIGSFLFVSAAIWTKDKYSSVMFWATVAFFGGGGLFLLIRFLNPNNLFVKHDTGLGRQILAGQFQKAQENAGLFDDTDTGFNVTDHNEEAHYRWLDIKQFSVLKKTAIQQTKFAWTYSLVTKLAFV